MTRSFAFALCLWLLSLGVRDAEARSQRMFLPMGTLKIAAKGKITPRAYCLDFNRPIPRIEQPFGHVLIGGTSKVRIGDKEISLERAIADRLLVIRGTGDFEDLTLENRSGKDMQVVIDQPTVFGQYRESVTEFARDLDRFKPNAPFDFFWDGDRERYATALK